MWEIALVRAQRYITKPAFVVIKNICDSPNNNFVRLIHTQFCPVENPHIKKYRWSARGEGRARPRAPNLRGRAAASVPFFFSAPLPLGGAQLLYVVDVSVPAHVYNMRAPTPPEPKNKHREMSTATGIYKIAIDSISISPLA